MRDVEDDRWRQAASALGLVLVDAEGRSISHKRATRANSMRGTLNGREVLVGHGRGITTIDVRLARPLVLGAKVQVSAPPKAPNGRFAGPGQTVIAGIESERVRQMLAEPEPGRELMETLRWLGSLGWAQLTDTRLRTQSEIYVEAPEGYVGLIRAVLGAALHAEEAREALEPAEWETKLRRDLEAAAGELHLNVSNQGFAIRGLVRRAPVMLQLLATDRYVLSGHVRFSRPMPADTIIERRTGWLSRLAALLGVDRPTSDTLFNRAFRTSGDVRQHLSADTISDILDLSGEGDIRVDRAGVAYKTQKLTVSAANLIPCLVTIAERLNGNLDASPYR